MKCVYAAMVMGIVGLALTVEGARDEGWRWVLEPCASAELRGGAYADQPSSEGTDRWVRGGTEPDDVSVVLLQYDLTEIDLTNTAHAVIFYRGDAEGPGENPSMAVYGVDNDWEQDSVTMNTAPQRRERIYETTIRKDTAWGVAFYLTDYVRTHYHEGRVSFLIEMRSAPGFSRSMHFSGKPPLALVKVQAPLYDFDQMLHPIWAGKRIYNETLAPTSYEGGMAHADLAFEPDRVLRVMDYGLQKTYEEGRDYVIEGRTLRLTPDSTIPFLKMEDLYFEGTNTPHKLLQRLDGGSLVLDSNLFNDHQLCVTYDHSDPWSGPMPQEASDQLPRTLAKLKQGEPVKVVLFGDSISVGGESSAKNHRAPFMPVWSDLASTKVKQHYPGPVDWVNPSLGGTVTRWGVETVDGLAAFEKPDLAIIAFGMNDGGWMSVEEFMANTQTIMAAFRAQNPAVEFLLIVSIVPNARWRDLTLMQGYREKTLALQGPGLAVADIWGMHEYLLGRKTYWDMTTNHVNHPNDFLARLYAQVISTMLGAYE